MLSADSTLFNCTEFGESGEFDESAYAGEFDDSGKSGDSGESGESGISHVNRAKAEICSVEEKMIKKLFQCLLKRSENIKKTS